TTAAPAQAEAAPSAVVMSAATRSTPDGASAFPRRFTARTGRPRAASSATTARPVPPLAPSTTDTPVTTSPRGGRLDHLGEHGGVVRAEERSAVDEERRGARHAQRLALGEVAGHGGGDVVA